MRVLVLLALVVAICAAAVTGQRLLSLPEISLCDSRPKQWQHDNHNYFFSWDQDDFKEVNPKTGKLEGRKVDWLEARNQCRKHCMDAVGIESESENKMIFDFIAKRNITYIWTSGRLCDFDGCDTREDLKPLSVNGWFWSNTNTKMAATNQKPPGWATQPWSPKGHENGGPQPDNAEFDINQTSESCLGVLNNLYADGIKWHDIACYHKKPFICEDSDELLGYIEGEKRKRSDAQRQQQQGQGQRQQGQGQRQQGQGQRQQQQGVQRRFG